MKQIIKVVLRITAFIGAMYLWLLFAFNTMDRSPEAFKHTGGNPLLNKYAGFLLALIILVFIFRSVVSKKIGAKSILSKIVFGLFLIIGIIVYSSALK